MAKNNGASFSPLDPQSSSIVRDNLALRNVPEEYRDMVRQSAQAHGLDVSTFVKQLYTESRFNPNAVSPAGAIGIGQIMPSTAKGYNVNPAQLNDPYTNIDLAGRIMEDNLQRYHGNMDAALAAYNGGNRAGAAALQGQFSRMPKETQGYLAKITGTTSPTGTSMITSSFSPVNNQGAMSHNDSLLKGISDSAKQAGSMAMELLNSPMDDFEEFAEMSTPQQSRFKGLL